MSAETRAAVEDAIRAHVADESDDPRVVVDWVVLTSDSGADMDSTGYYYACRDGMPWHSLTGLLSHFLRRLEHDSMGRAS